MAGTTNVRQLHDAKIKPLVETFNAKMLDVYAQACGWALARAHAKASEISATISGYLGGSSDVFDAAMGKFALAYADQAERDHATLKAAIRNGKVIASQGFHKARIGARRLTDDFAVAAVQCNGHDLERLDLNQVNFPGTAAVSLALCPNLTRGPTMEDPFLNYFALGLLFFVVIVLVYGIIAIHDIPARIAHARHHPHEDAIHAAGWISLFLLHLLWPFLWIWAMMYRPDRGWGFASYKPGEPTSATKEAVAEAGGVGASPGGGQRAKVPRDPISKRVISGEGPAPAWIRFAYGSDDFRLSRGRMFLRQERHRR